MAERRPTLLHGCASAATAAEASYRVDYPNSGERSSRVIALDDGAAELVAPVAAMEWHGARFLTFAGTTPVADGGSLEVDGLLRTIDGQESLLSDELEGADVAVMIATGDAAADAAAVIGRACWARAIMTAGLVVAGTGEAAAVRALRPFASVLVVSRDHGYVPEMLVALRA